MGRQKLTNKLKRNNFTLTKEAQSIIDAVSKNKSAYVSQALIAFKPTGNININENFNKL